MTSTDIETIRADTEAFRCHPDCGICLACALSAHIDSLLDERERIQRIVEKMHPVRPA
jgi:hypothetical protein